MEGASCSEYPAPLDTQQMVLVAATAAVMKSKGPGQSLNLTAGRAES